MAAAHLLAALRRPARRAQMVELGIAVLTREGLLVLGTICPVVRERRVVVRRARSVIVMVVEGGSIVQGFKFKGESYFDLFWYVRCGALLLVICCENCCTWTVAKILLIGEMMSLDWTDALAAGEDNGLV